MVDSAILVPTPDCYLESERRGSLLESEALRTIRGPCAILEAPMETNVSMRAWGATLQRLWCLSHVTRDTDSTRVILNHETNVRKSNIGHSQMVMLMLSLCVCVLSPVRLFVTSWTVARQTPLYMGFSQESWGGLLFLSPRDLPDSGIEPRSPVSLALQADSIFFFNLKSRLYLFLPDFLPLFFLFLKLNLF